MQKRAAFTLIEVLISIVLLGIILPALYESVKLLRDSNSHLFEHLQISKNELKEIQTLFLDIASSDGNLTLHNDEFDRLCLEHTKNSLYGLFDAKVCWVVLKEGPALLRIEGNGYHLPLRLDEHVQVDKIMKKVSLFDIHWKDDKVLVFLQEEGKEAVSFMVQGVTKPKPKQKKHKRASKKKTKKNPSQSHKKNSQEENMNKSLK